MWIARSKSGIPILSYDKPELEIGESGEWESDSYIVLLKDDFPNITFENSPQEVFVMTKEEKEEEFNKGVKFATDLAVKLMR